MGDSSEAPSSDGSAPSGAAAAPAKRPRQSCDPAPGAATFKARGGSSEYYLVSSHLPEGPSTVEALALWPQRLMRDIFQASSSRPIGAELRRRRCEAFFELGEVLHTDFSGVGCPEMSKRLMAVMFDDWKFKLNSKKFCVSWRVADCDDTCRSVFMMDSDAAQRPMHVFGALTDRLPPEHRDAIVAMCAPCSKAGRPLDIGEAQMRHKNMQKYISKHGSEMFDNASSKSCLLHLGHACQVAFKKLHKWPRPVSTLIAGPMCIPWTSFGAQLGDAHPSMESLHVWLEGASRGQHDMVIMENNKWFPWKMFRQKFEKQAKVIRIVTGPERMGWPASRERLFLTALSYDSIVWLGPQTDEEISDHFHAIFGARAVMEGDAFICDTTENAIEFRKEIAAKRGIYGERGLASCGNFLSPGSKKRLETYKKQRENLMGMAGTYLCDVSQDPDNRCIAGAWVPTCTRSSQLVSLTASTLYDGVHFLTLDEVGFSQGWPTITMDHNRRFAQCVPSSLRTLSSCARRSLVGNGIHLVPLTAWSLYVAAHSVRREYLHGIAPQLWFNFDQGSNEDDQEEPDL